MLVAIGASADLPLSCEVLNYEAPFGVGYLVAQLTHQPGRLPEERTRCPPALARQAVETFIRSGNVLDPPETGGRTFARARAVLCLSEDSRRRAARLYRNDRTSERHSRRRDSC